MFGEKIKNGADSVQNSLSGLLRSFLRYLPRIMGVIAIVFGIMYVGYRAGYVMATQRHYQGFNPETGAFNLRGASVYLSGNCSVMNSEKLINLLFHEAKVTYVDENSIVAVLSNLQEPMTVQCATKTTTIDNLSYPDIRDAIGKNKERPGKYSIIEKKKEEQNEVLKFKGRAVVASANCKDTSSNEALPSFTEKILDVLSVEQQGEKTFVYAIKRDDQKSIVCDSRSFMARFATEQDLTPKETQPTQVQPAVNVGNMTEAEMANNPTAINYEGKTLLVSSSCRVKGKNNEWRSADLINHPVEVSRYYLDPNDKKFKYIQGLSGVLEGQVICDAKEWPINAVLKTSNITLKSFETKENKEKKK